MIWSLRSALACSRAASFAHGSDPERSAGWATVRLLVEAGLRYGGRVNEPVLSPSSSCLPQRRMRRTNLTASERAVEVGESRLALTLLGAVADALTTDRPDVICILRPP